MIGKVSGRQMSRSKTGASVSDHLSFTRLRDSLIRKAGPNLSWLAFRDHTQAYGRIQGSESVGDPIARWNLRLIPGATSRCAAASGEESDRVSPVLESLYVLADYRSAPNSSKSSGEFQSLWPPPPDSAFSLSEGNVAMLRKHSGAFLVSDPYTRQPKCADGRPYCFDHISSKQQFDIALNREVCLNVCRAMNVGSFIAESFSSHVNVRKASIASPQPRRCIIRYVYCVASQPLGTLCERFPIFARNA